MCAVCASLPVRLTYLATIVHRISLELVVGALLVVHTLFHFWPVAARGVPGVWFSPPLMLSFRGLDFVI